MSGVDVGPCAVEPPNPRKEGSRRRSRLRGFTAATVAAVSALALAGAPAALGADQQVNHFRDVGTDVDPDFCGTGHEIDIAFDVRVTEWLAPNQADYRNTTTGKVTFTNPLTGDTVINLFAGSFADVTVSGDPEGIHVHEFTNKGLPELFKTPQGGVISRDAGYIVFRDTFDGDTFISGEIAINRGPHPQADSDFELFCQFMVPALGL